MERAEIVKMVQDKTHFVVWRLTPTKFAFLTATQLALFGVGNSTVEEAAGEMAKKAGLPLYIVEGNTGIGVAAHPDGRETYQCKHCTEEHSTDEAVTLSITLRALEKFAEDLRAMVDDETGLKPIDDGTGNGWVN